MFVPSPNTEMVVSLPGEQMRAVVSKLIDNNTVIVQIGQPLTRNHSFRKDDFVACRRRRGELGETWEAMEIRPEPVFPEPEPEPIPVAVVGEEPKAKRAARGHR